MKNLELPPRTTRFAAVKSPVASETITEDGGRWGGGLIPGVSLCTRGEALGHGHWCDQEMIDQIVEATNASGKYIKSRFAHPDMCSDGTGKALGTIENGRVQGDQAIGDLHLYKSAHNAPDGDLAGYVISMAKEDPQNFGLSIVFERDTEAEDAFTAANTQGKDGSAKYVSPDELNKKNLPHVRLKKLWAADVVDDPAANANGLFHRDGSIVEQATALLDYATGKTAEAPKVTAFNIAPERIREFLGKYLSSNGLELKKEPQMAEEQQAPEIVDTDALIKQGREQERERQTKIVALCAQAKMPQLAAGFCENVDFSVEDVQKELFKALCKQNAAIGDEGGTANDTAPPDDGNNKYRQEYKAQPAYAKEMTEEEYISLRRIEDGVEPLLPMFK